MLAWLAEHQPQLTVVSERSWLWITTKLKGDEHEAEREAIKTMLDGNGFKFARKGHTLPCGHVAYWAHPCMKPTPFYSRGGKKASSQGTIHDTSEWDRVREEALAFLDA